MNLGIKGLSVLVTAGAGGIGLEIARSFVAEGARVHVCDVDQKALRALAKSDPKITRSKSDVSDRKQVAKLFRRRSARSKGLDVLVNNAGIAGPTGKVDEIAPEDWDRCLAIDITGQFNCTRLAVPHLRKSKNASIVNLSSAAGRLGFPLRTPYSAAKWARGRLHQVARGRARAGRHPLQRDPAGHRRGRAHRPRDGEQGEGARASASRRCWRRRSRSSRCAPR